MASEKTKQEVKELLEETAGKEQTKLLREKLEEARKDNLTKGRRGTMMVAFCATVPAGAVISRICGSWYPVILALAALAIVFIFCLLVGWADHRRDEMRAPKIPECEKAARQAMAEEIVKLRGGTEAHYNEAKGTVVAAAIFGPVAVGSFIGGLAVVGAVAYVIIKLTAAIFF